MLIVLIVGGVYGPSLHTSFFLILAPTASFVPIITEVVAEHRMYLPLAAVIVAGVLARTSIHRRNDYGSKELIWCSVLEVYEDSPWPLTGFGFVEAKHDRRDGVLPPRAQA